MCVCVWKHIRDIYAEFALSNANSVHLLPDHISFSPVAAIYVPNYTAYRALFQRFMVIMMTTEALVYKLLF